MEQTTHSVLVSDGDLLVDSMRGALRRICQVLSCSSGIHRIEVAINRDRAGEETMETITQAKMIAREYDLTMYVRFEAGDFRITFTKPSASQSTALPAGAYERKHP